MKYLKIIFLLIVASVTTSCESEKEKLVKQYIECCAEGNFDQARAAASKLEAEYPWTTEGAMKYVNDKEIYALLAKPSHDNASRIIYLYNTYESDQLPDFQDVLEVAISMNNEILSEKLIKSEVNVNTKIAKAAIGADMDALIELIVSKEPDIIFEHEVGSAYKSWKGVEGYNEIIRKALNRQVQELSNFELPARPAIGVVIGWTNIKDQEKYSSDISEYNSKCYKFIVQAVNINEFELANKALSMMKPTLDIKQGKDVDGKHQYFVTESRHQIDEARQYIQSAKH